MLDSHGKLTAEKGADNMRTEATKAAKARYDAKTAKYYSLKLNTNTDREMIEHLAKQENVQGYLKELIRKDMKGAKPMTYKIKPEFLDLWGSDATEDTIITEDDLEMITRGWDKTPADVMDQLIPLE